MTNILLQTLSSQDIHWLKTTGKPCPVQAGQDLINHHAVDTAYLLLEGTVAVNAELIEHSARATQSLSYFQPGEMLGLLSPQDGGDRLLSLQSIDDSLLLAIPRSQLQSKLQADHSFAAHLYQAEALLLARRQTFLIKQLNSETVLACQPQRESVTVFSILEDRDLDWLITVGKVQLLTANTNLIESGQSPDSLHILLDGTCVMGAIEDSRSTLLRAFDPIAPTEHATHFQEFARLSRGDLIGETVFVNANPTNMVVKVLFESRVLSIPRWRLAAKLCHDVEFASRFYRLLVIILTHQQKLMLQQLGHDDRLDENETDSECLEKVGLAEARFEWMLKQIKAERGTGREIQW